MGSPQSLRKKKDYDTSRHSYFFKPIHESEITAIVEDLQIKSGIKIKLGQYKDIPEIQKKLEHDQTQGLIVFTQNNPQDFDALVIEKKRVINFNLNLTQVITSSEDEVIYSTSFPGLPEINSYFGNNFNLKKLSLRLTNTQKILILKELLLEEAKQHSLCLSDSGIHYFFLPPHILKYVVNREYAEYLLAMLEDGDEHGQVEFKSQDGKSYRITTLITYLENFNQNHAPKEKISNESFKKFKHSEFAKFKQAWIKTYHKMMDEKPESQNILSEEIKNELQYENYNLKKGIRLFYLDEKNPTLKLSEWNAGDYYLLMHQNRNPQSPKEFYYVDKKSNKHVIKGVDLNLVHQATNNNCELTFLNQQQIATLGLDGHIVYPELDRLNKVYEDAKQKYNKPDFFQKMIGMNNTLLWQIKADEIRFNAYVSLKKMLKGIQNEDDKISLIDYAVTLDLFKEHRSNYTLTKNTDETRTVWMLEKMKEEIENNKKVDRSERANAFQIY